MSRTISEHTNRYPPDKHVGNLADILGWTIHRPKRVDVYGNDALLRSTINHRLHRAHLSTVLFPVLKRSVARREMWVHDSTFHA